MLLLLTVIKDKSDKYLRKRYTDVLLPFSITKPMDLRQMCVCKQQSSSMCASFVRICDHTELWTRKEKTVQTLEKHYAKKHQWTNGKT